MGLIDLIRNSLDGLVRNLPKRKPKEESKKNDSAIKDYTITEMTSTSEPIRVKVLDISPNVYLVNKAAKLSRGNNELPTYEERLKHIQSLLKMGHESILEHSNIVALITIPVKVLDRVNCISSLVDLLAQSRYLHIATTHSNDHINILIGGSIRGYINIVRECDPDNEILYIIKDILYESTEKEFLVSLLNENLITESQCVYRAISDLKVLTSLDENGEEIKEFEAIIKKDPDVITGDTVDLIYAGDPLALYKEINEYGFTLKDAYRMETVTFLFHNISRAIGNQLVRHRVGITQESQRYCTHDTDMTTDFVDPIDIHLKSDDRYKDLDIVNIDKYLHNHNPFNSYKHLLNKKVSKEDARYWLPLGVTTKIMMTFTYKQYSKFLELRTDKAAQLEIRNLANHTINLINNHPSAKFIFDASKDDPKKFFVNECLSVISSQEQKMAVGIDEEVNIIDTDDESVQPSVELKPEDMKSLDIKNVEDAERYLKQSEEMKSLENK